MNDVERNVFSHVGEIKHQRFAYLRYSIHQLMSIPSILDSSSIF